MADTETNVEQHLEAWADVLSFILLGITILIAGGVDPRRRIWGRSNLRNVLLILFLSINIIYSAGRFIAEGILVETGPREFLLLAVVYCLRWLWLYVAISKRGSCQAKAFRVARALRELKMIRLGKSTKGRETPTDDKKTTTDDEKTTADDKKATKDDKKATKDDKKTKRNSFMARWLKKGKEKSVNSTHSVRDGKFELVVRRGARVVQGVPYWRGVEDKVEYFENKNQVTHRVRQDGVDPFENVVTPDTYLVCLVEQELHANALAEIGTVEFRRKIETASSDELYKMFYDLVMTIDGLNKHLIVDYKPFLQKTQPVVTAKSWQPKRVGATDPSDLGNVARRVAADACVYVFQSGPDIEFRTKRHVKLINECLDNAVDTYFTGMTQFGSDNNV